MNVRPPYHNAFGSSSIIVHRRPCQRNEQHRPPAMTIRQPAEERREEDLHQRVGHYTVGAVLEEQAALADAEERRETEGLATAEPSAFLLEVFGELESEAGSDVAFDYGLNALIAGFEASRS